MSGLDPSVGLRSFHGQSLREAARLNAGPVFASMGARSIGAVSARLRDVSLSSEQRRYVRLMIVELERLERLDRRHRAGRGSNYLVVFKRRIFSLRRCVDFFRRALRRE
jgi:hypothetical protein